MSRIARASVVFLLAFPIVACQTDPSGADLRVGRAPAALCVGGANREDDGSHDGSGSGDDGGLAQAGPGVGVSASYGSIAATGSGSGEQVGSGGSGDGGAGGWGRGGAGGSGDGGAGGGGAGGSGDGGAGGGGADGGGAARRGLGEARSALAQACSGVDVSAPTKLYLSSDDSNSMASPVILRRLIESGASTFSPRLVRTHEVLNYYRYTFAPPEPGELRIVSQLGTCDLSEDFALQIAVVSSPDEARPPMTITLVLDTSGSMAGEPIALQHAAVAAIASTLSAGDVVSLVTWSTDQTPILEGHVVVGPDDPTLLAAVEAATAGGGTDLESGLRVGYELAERHRRGDGINRVVLVSDGQANVGITSETLIGEAAEDQDGEGIYLVGVGVGEGINDTLMDVVTDAGRGAYVYLDSAEEARRIFVERFAETMLVAARDVQIELTLPGYFGITRFYGEEYSPDPAKVRTQHLAPGDSMMLYQIIRPCDPDLPRADDPYRVRVTWGDPRSGRSRTKVQATTLGQLGIDDGNLAKAAAVIAYAEALKALVPGSEPEARVAALESAIQVVEQTPRAWVDPDLIEIRRLLQLARAHQSG